MVACVAGLWDFQSLARGVGHIFAGGTIGVDFPVFDAWTIAIVGVLVVQVAPEISAACTVLPYGSISCFIDANDPDPLPIVRRPDVSGGDSGDLHRVASPVEPGRHRVQVPPSESADVFDDNAARSEFLDDPKEVEPEPAAGSGGDAST